MSASDGDADLRLLHRPPPGHPARAGELDDRLATAAGDAGAVTDMLAESCLALPADLVVVLLAAAGPGEPGPLRTAAVRHLDPDRTGHVDAALHEEDGEPGPLSLPAGADALPAPVRTALAAAGASDVVVAPVTGRLLPLGVVVAARLEGSPPFGALERDFAVGAGRRCGAALEVARLAAEVRHQAAELRRLGGALDAALAGAESQTRFAQELMDALDHRGAVLDREGTVISANARWRAALADRDRCACGPVAEGENWLEALARQQSGVPAALAADVGALLLGERESAQAECRCAAEGPGRATAVEVVRVVAGQGGAIVVQSDVSWRRRMQDELTYRATHDELTGLPNRAALMEGLRAALERLDGRRRLAVLFCDLDGFKDVNDGLGHAVGDQVLVAVARRLRQRCRQADVVARFGGDEFVVVLSIDDLAQAVAMAERIVEVLAEPIVVGDVEVAPGVSVGVTVTDAAPDGDDPVGMLLRDADTAMYHAKDRGRGRFELFDARLRENISRRLELAAALHRAVGADELELLYQSRRYCGDRQVAGVEALLSWRHPVLGRIAPEVFIPIAERTGRIVELGEWVLRRALTEFAAVPDRRMTLAVNVSPRQLGGARFPEMVADALAASGLEPWRLVLEITESALVDDPAAAREVLTELRGLGVTIALDDFGTGWSSLSYLRTLPVDVLKVDRSFVRDLPTDPDACAVVSAVLGLGHGMGLVVVAEGVEREDQLTVLREMGCDEYQGFIDGRPAALADVLAFTPR